LGVHNILIKFLFQKSKVLPIFKNSLIILSLTKIISFVIVIGILPI